MSVRNLIFLMRKGLLLAAVLLCSCSTAPDLHEEEDRVFRLGVLGPFSGHNEQLGAEFIHAVEIAFEKADYRIADYRVELVWIDSQSDAERATLAYERAAADEGISACILNWHSSVAVAAMDVSARHRLPHFFGLGATEVINEKLDYDPGYYAYYLAKGWPSPAQLTGAYVLALEEAVEANLWLPEAKTVALYGEDSPWGRSFTRAIGEDFTRAGWEIVASEYFPTGDTDLYYLVNRLADYDATVIAGSVATGPSYDAFIRELYETGFSSVVVADGLGWSISSRQTINLYGNKMLDQVAGWKDNRSEVFKREFTERAGHPPNPAVGGLAYDYTNYFIQIAEETYSLYGELNRETLAEFGIEKLPKGLFSYNDGIVMHSYRYCEDSYPDPVVAADGFIFPVVQYTRGESTVIWPEELRQESFVPPPPAE